MAKARLYALVEGMKPKRELRGQAAQVLADLQANPEPRLAMDIDKSIQETKPYVTRQDSLRVTLYYLLVFKKQGLVRAVDPPVEAEETAAEGEAVAEGTEDAVAAVASARRKDEGRRGKKSAAA